MKRKLFLLAAGLCVMAILGLACTFFSTIPRRVSSADTTVTIQAPCKAHLCDGSLLIFEKGFVATPGILLGQASRWDVARRPCGTVSSVPTDSVVFLEYYSREVQAGPMFGSLVGPAFFAIALTDPEIYKALFGSCPTVFTYDGESTRREAECFSNSIAPWCARPDLDRLDYGRPENGIYRLRLRNEALETHYIDQLELLAVDHAPGLEPFPAAHQKILLFGQEAHVRRAQDALGRDVTRLLAVRDDEWYESDTSLIRQFTYEPVRDWVDLEVDVPPGARDMVVALRVRNTLLNTVYFYDVALGSQGVRALEWMDWGFSDFPKMLPLKNTLRDNFALRIESRDGERVLDETTIGDTGPIVWRMTAAKLRAPGAPVATLRFSSMPGNYAIDWIGVSFDPPQDFSSEACPLVSADPGREVDAARLLARRDGEPLITYPRDACELAYRLPPAVTGATRSYFVRSYGYYVEWLRRDWFMAEDGSLRHGEIRVDESDLARTAALWLDRKTDFERRFFGTALIAAKEN